MNFILLCYYSRTIHVVSSTKMSFQRNMKGKVLHPQEMRCWHNLIQTHWILWHMTVQWQMGICPTAFIICAEVLAELSTSSSFYFQSAEQHQPLSFLLYISQLKINKKSVNISHLHTATSQYLSCTSKFCKHLCKINWHRLQLNNGKELWLSCISYLWVKNIMLSVFPNHSLLALENNRLRYRNS